MSKPALEIKTPKGTIEVTPSTDPNYPGVWVEIDGQQVALLEWADEKHVVRIWDDPNIDPIFIHEVKKFEWEEK